ncbi:unnamed protein product [Cochlearia groenlandica]
MPRRKATVVVSPQAAATVVRRSARLISQRNRDGEVKPKEDLDFGSEPPRRSRRKLVSEASKKLEYSPEKSIGDLGSKKSEKLMDGFIPLRGSLRVMNKGSLDSSKEKSPRCCSMKLGSTSSSCPVTLRRSPRSSGNSVMSRCSTKSILSEKGDVLRTRDRSRSRLCSKTKQMFRDCDDDDDGVEEEVSVCLGERKKMRLAMKDEEEKAVTKDNEGKRIGRDDKEEEEEENLKTKKKLEKGWTKELELALQGAYLTVKPSPNFWRKVSKLVPGKSAQECFDKVNSDLITPRQAPPRSRASKTNFTVSQFSLSASKLLKPDSPKAKKRQRRNNLSKKTMRHLLEKQNHMDQGLGSDLFSVFEPSISTSGVLSTPTENRQRLPKILESPVPCSRFASKDETTLVSPLVLKQVKNKALHEKYIDHLHIREAKRKAESTRLSRKENIRPIDNQRKYSVRAAKDALLFGVQDAMQKLKSLETENSSSSSEFCYERGESDEEDESI